jgi:uncharacterized membrane protein YfcA
MRSRQQGCGSTCNRESARNENATVFKLVIVALVVLPLAVVMSMTGRGGGNFYVLTFVLAGVPMHEAATTGQFVLCATALATMFVFQKHKTVLLPLALLMGGMLVTTAFAGGYFAHLFTGVTLKVVFSLLLVLAGILMLLPMKERTTKPDRASGYWHLRAADHVYHINLWIVVSAALVTGFCAGMVGVSGGSFLVPLMVLGCRVPMRLAVGTASIMIAATAFSGFLGHAMHGSFNPAWAWPLAGVAVGGGTLGGKIALKTKPTYLKTLFAFTTFAAAILMMVNALAAR